MRRWKKIYLNNTCSNQLVCVSWATILKLQIIIIFVVAALASTLPVLADPSAVPATNTITVTTTGTNGFVRVTIGTNSVILPIQGNNPVVQIVQVPPPAPPPSPPPVKPRWESSASAGFALTRGNSSTLLWTGRIGTQKKEDANEYILGADGAYGVNNGQESQDTIHGSAQYNHLFSERLYGFANADALHDGIQDLKYRFSLSPGAGYYFIKEKTRSLVGELGPGVVSEERGDTPETYMSMRLSEKFDQKLTQAARLWEKAEIIPQVNQFDNYVVNAELGLESALRKNLSLQVIFDDNFVNQPAAGRQKNDIKLVSGIAYKF